MELHSETMDGVALATLSMEFGIFSEVYLAPVLVDWHHTRRLCWKEEG